MGYSETEQFTDCHILPISKEEHLGMETSGLETNNAFDRFCQMQEESPRL